MFWVTIIIFCGLPESFAVTLLKEKFVKSSDGINIGGPVRREGIGNHCLSQ